MQGGAEGGSVRLEGKVVELKIGFTLCLLGLTQQGCRGFERRGQENLRHGQSGTSCHRRTTLRLFSIKSICS